MGFSVWVCLDCFLILFLLVIYCPPSVCVNAELEVLMNMKHDLDPHNIVLASWTKEGNYCRGDFVGVACNNEFKVANISLQGRLLSGKVPSAVRKLNSLTSLYLHYNSLTGEIPTSIFHLTELSDLYLNSNNLSGNIPLEIGTIANLKVLQLSHNNLSGVIPTQIGDLKLLSVLALQHNRLNGTIPESLGKLEKLTMLNLSFNNLNGSIPDSLAAISQLEVLDVQNNDLSGPVSPALQRLSEGFQFQNNKLLCGVFSSLKNCSPLGNNDLKGVPIDNATPAKLIPKAASINLHCNQTHCSTSSKFRQAALVAGSVTFVVSLLATGLLTLVHYRRQKHKISSLYDSSEGSQSADLANDCHKRTPPFPLVSLEYSNGLDPFADGQNCNEFRFNLEEVESATQYFSEVNLLRKSKFSSIYKGILRDGSLVAIRSLGVTSCKSEEAEFAKGLNLLTSLRHENIVQLRGFCCSRGRGECFLIYDFAPNGNLSSYLDVQDGSRRVLDWSTRVSIISGIAKGIGYLHSSQPNKPAMIHRNISAEKVLIDQRFNPLISDSGLPKLLADDVIFSALKTSAALGYLAPEYITTGSFTEKSDTYAFGVIILQVLSGTQLSTSIQVGAESSKFMEFVDPKLHGKFSESEAAKLAKIATACTLELPEQRPTMEVIQELLSK